MYVIHNGDQRHKILKYDYLFLIINDFLHISESLQ